jgi:organic radical activating enzyme
MISKTAMETANIFSIFTSLQGEGVYLGVPQIFIRFSGCNIRCKYCDTTEALTPQAVARIEPVAFSGKTNLVPNPLSVETVLNATQQLEQSFQGFHSISLTGGEPLLADGFLKRLLPLLREIGLEIFLETNGTLPERLANIIDLVDIISMDIKVPSSLEGKFDWGKTEQFLKATGQKNCCAKLVVCDAGTDEEFQQASEIIARVNPAIPLVLQPVYDTSNRQNGYGSLSLKRLLGVHRIFRKQLKDVRIIPQVHKLMGWL